MGRKADGSLERVEGLTELPDVLNCPKRGAPKKVMTDASSYGLGGVLLQMSEGGK